MSLLVRQSSDRDLGGRSSPARDLLGENEALWVRCYGRTDIGLEREHNEDDLLVADLNAREGEKRGATMEAPVGGLGCVFAVFDGMGGAAAGEVASQMAVSTVLEVMQGATAPQGREGFARRLVRATEEAGARIFAAGNESPSCRGMGTTATVAGLIDATLFVAQVGDSRAYVLRGDELVQVTKDQSLVTQLVESGRLTAQQAEASELSNILLQALGTAAEVHVDLTFAELRRGDRLLLCSDGLSGLVPHDVIRAVLLGTANIVEATARLISTANAYGGHDNITVVLVEFSGSSLAPPDPAGRLRYERYPLQSPGPAAGVPGLAVVQGAATGDDPSFYSLFWLGMTVWFVVMAAVLAALAFHYSTAVSRRGGDALDQPSHSHILMRTP